MLAFQYAVDASWAAPSGPSAPPKPIDEYPVTANCPEAFNITVDSSKSKAYYADAGDFGGDLVLDVEVFDWGAGANPDGIDGEIDSIEIESETLFDNVISVPVKASPGSQTVSGIYSVMVPYVHPTGLENQEVLVTVRSKSPATYEPPMAGKEYPTGAHLAAYTLVDIPILDVNRGELRISSGPVSERSGTT
jgi:hypothetical protein